MGIPGLWEILEPTSQNASLVEISVREGFVKNHHGTRTMVVGVDASSMVYNTTKGVCPQSCSGHLHIQAEKNPELRALFSRLAWLSKSAVSVVFVFDGPDRPVGRKGDNEMRTTSESDLEWITSKFGELITGFGFHSHTAPGEAEAELAFLNATHAIDVVLTSDNNIFLFGAKQVIQSPSHCPGDFQPCENLSMFTANQLKYQDSNLFTVPGFFLMAILSGGDYDTIGLPNCDTAIASAVAKGPLAQELYQAGKFYPEDELSHFLSIWRDSLKEELALDPDGRLGRRYPSLARNIPASFPDPKVIKQYCCPATSPNVPDDAIAWLIPTVPNTAALANFCDGLFDWGPNIIDRFISHVWDGLLLRKIIKNFHGTGTTMPVGRPSFITPTFDRIQKISTKKLDSPSGFFFYQVGMWIPSLTAEAATVVLGAERHRPNNVVHGLSCSHSMSILIPAPLLQITNPEVIARYYQNTCQSVEVPEISSALYSPVLEV